MNKSFPNKDTDYDRNSDKVEGQGRFQLLPQEVRVDFSDGSAIVAPLGEATISASSVAITVGDIITIGCKLFPKLCGGGGGGGGAGGGGGGGGCYIIIGPDGTKITICPPPPKVA